MPTWTNLVVPSRTYLNRILGQDRQGLASLGKDDIMDGLEVLLQQGLPHMNLGYGPATEPFDHNGEVRRARATVAPLSCGARRGFSDAI